ncbi:hypothetical protein GR702_16275 [Novosphingobium sp. FGD1]|uniref:Uncharacterized protein n=1 Tax=Novosphingobium silvae TaxID=2692619 RepID=A0A7X4K8K8_9SPHN|nr:hypothetical protein [Novosphingobium silvae]MYL99325.1 hypothetical protein [Novosphingobium silvae]
MAFIDFTDATIQAPSPVMSNAMAPADARAEVRHGLTLLEQRVVALARGDGLDTLRPQRKRGWLARLILGPTPPSAMLANEELEALRRLAVHAWHKGYTLPASALKEARAAGHSEAKIGAVIDIIGRSRVPFRRLAA